MVFKTQFDPHDRVFCDSGDPVVKEYELRFDDYGVEDLVEVGERNLYDEIQSHALSCDINYILARYKSGDVEALSRRQGVYADFSQMPKTYADMLNALNQATITFESLPLDVRSQFGNSMEAWLSTYGTDDWSKKMGYDSVDPAELRSSDVKESDSE